MVLHRMLLQWAQAAVKYGHLLALTALLSMAARAELVENLYQQSELVTGQSTAERQQATRQALAKVLVRVSGRSALLQSAGIQSVLDKPQQFVEAYRYESTDDIIEQDGLPVPAARLVFNFSRAGIERLLRTQQAPLWPANRPSVLVWLVKDDLSAGRELVSLQDGSELSAAASSLSELRGQPLVLPVLDLQDRLTISADQVWNLDQAAIIEASARYQADVLLIGRYSQTSSGRWLSAWTLLHKQHQQVFDRDSAQEVDLVSQGLGAATDFLASVYSISSLGGDTDSVLLEVQQVNGFSNYVQLLSYLDALEVVRQLDLVLLEEQTIRVKIKLEGESRSLIDALELDRRLQPVVSRESTPVALPKVLEAHGSENNPLRYRWPSQ
jgi:uncharacterized protein